MSNCYCTVIFATLVTKELHFSITLTNKCMLEIGTLEKWVTKSEETKYTFCKIDPP